MSDSNTKMSEEQFWINIMKMVAAVLCILIMSITGSCQVDKYSIVSMVDAGASPLEAACALDVVTGQASTTRPECITLTNQLTNTN